jgi:predicted RNase H-like HicB family nuclease
MSQFVKMLKGQGAQGLKSYRFQVVVERDGDAWLAYCPALLEKGGSSWGRSREEALKNIHQVVEMVVQSLVEHGETIPSPR